jgi:hypothetical protein
MEGFSIRYQPGARYGTLTLRLVDTGARGLAVDAAHRLDVRALRSYQWLWRGEA